MKCTHDDILCIMHFGIFWKTSSIIKSYKPIGEGHLTICEQTLDSSIDMPTLICALNVQIIVWLVSFLKYALFPILHTVATILYF